MGQVALRDASTRTGCLVVNGHRGIMFRWHIGGCVTRTSSNNS